jgi:hypothetical protein
MTVHQLSSYCQTALPFLGLIYTAMLIVEALVKRRNLLKQLFSFALFAAMAYFRIFVTGPPA